MNSTATRAAIQFADGKISTFKSAAHAEKERLGWARFAPKFPNSEKHQAMLTAMVVPV